MATKRKTPQTVKKTVAAGSHNGKHAVLAKGFGLDTRLRQKHSAVGRDYMDCHWVAVGTHPVHGLRVVGPFVDRDAAKNWINDDQCQYLTLEFADKTSDCTWSVTHLDVMTDQD